MRKAFVGLSTPVGYDYKNHATKTKADQFSCPNPILDSPFGLMILFDKLIFLSKSLCPENMRNLPFVEFLDESNKLPFVSNEELNLISEEISNSFNDTNRKSIRSDISFQQSVKGAGVLDGMGVDNHSHGLHIGEYSGQANADESNFAIDLLFCSRLNDPSIEVITNSRLRPLQNLPREQWAKAKLTELLVIENISNYLSPGGPYHPVIDEVRENQYIAEFRKWISNQKGFASLSEVKEMKSQVEHALQNAQAELFLKHLDPKRHFKSIGEAMFGDLVGLIYPASGTTKALLDAGSDIIKPDKNRWQGFVVGSRYSVRNYSSNA